MFKGIKLKTQYKTCIQEYFWVLLPVGWNYTVIPIKPGMQKAENSPVQFQAKNRIKPQQDSKTQTKHRVTVPKCRMNVKYRSSTRGRVNRDLPAPTVPLLQPRSPVRCRGAGNGTRNRVLIAFTSQSFEQQIINFSHSIINAL